MTQIQLFERLTYSCSILAVASLGVCATTVLSSDTGGPPLQLS